VRVTIPVLRLLNFKTVSIRAVISGTVAPGYHITNIVVEPQTVTLNGEASVLERIFSVDTTPVDVSGAQGEVVRAVSAIIPRQTSVDKQADVFVKVSVEPIPGGEVVRRPVVFKGLGKGLRVTSPLMPTVDIQLSGALPDLLAVTPKDITATLDLTDRGPGVYEIPVVVGALPEKLKVVRVTPERFFVIIDRIPP
jgi:YbbR domain-containing protein